MNVLYDERVTQSNSKVGGVHCDDVISVNFCRRLAAFGQHFVLKRAGSLERFVAVLFGLFQASLDVYSIT